MRVTVQYMGQLGHLAERSEESRELPEGASLLSLLEGLSAQYGEAFGHIVFTGENRIRPSMMVLVNDVPVEKTTPPVLRDGDQVTLLAAIAGG